MVHKFLCERDQPIRCSHEFGVCATEGISHVFVIKMDTTENCFSSQSSKKSSVPASSANKCRSSEKATANGFAVGDKNPSAVNLCASPGSCSQIAAIVCMCAWLCSVIACHHLTLLIAISARGRAHSTCEGAERWSNCARDSRSRHRRMLCPQRKPSGSYIVSCPVGSAHQPIRRHRLQSALDFRFEGPVEGVAGRQGSSQRGPAM